MIEVNGISKRFKLSAKQKSVMQTKTSYKQAVDNISFTAEKGNIYGLLGPNGAGKTTTLRCIATLLKPDSGEIFVDGLNINDNLNTVRKKICLLTNELKPDENLTPEYTAYYMAKLYGLSDTETSKIKEELFDIFGIKEYENAKIKSLSTGMKQKLSIAISLIHKPGVIIFDEPTNGLDVITARTVTDYLKKLRDEGRTVIISTHIMNVAQKLCDKIGIIMEGRLVAQGSLEEILNMTKTNDLDDAFFYLYSSLGQRG